MNLVRGDLKPMQEMAAVFLRDVESRPKSPEAVIAQQIRGMTLWYEGKFVEARRRLERALAITDSTQDREHAYRFGADATSLAMSCLPLVLWPLGVLDRAGQPVPCAGAAERQDVAAGRQDAQHLPPHPDVERDPGAVPPFAHEPQFVGRVGDHGVHAAVREGGQHVAAVAQVQRQPVDGVGDGGRRPVSHGTPAGAGLRPPRE